MDRIIPDDIDDSSFNVYTAILFKGNKLSFMIHTSFNSDDGIQYDAVIEHHEDGSIMEYSENSAKWKYCFSPYFTQKYIKFIMSEYAKNKPCVDHKTEVLGLINKIIQRNLSCEVVSDGKSE